MISCHQYDYIEIVCMYHYPIHLSLKSGDLIECNALDTKRNSQHQECIKVDIQGTKRLVVLDDITTLTVTVENPHFTVVSFT